jgi:hypothetical protein
MHPIHQDMFETWDAAVSDQTTALRRFLNAGYAIRTASIDTEQDFRDGKTWHKVFVRAFIVVEK